MGDASWKLVSHNWSRAVRVYDCIFHDYFFIPFLLISYKLLWLPDSQNQLQKKWGSGWRAKRAYGVRKGGRKRAWGRKLNKEEWSGRVGEEMGWWGGGRGLLPRTHLYTPKALLSICGTLTHWALVSECDLGPEATSLALEGESVSQD